MATMRVRPVPNRANGPFRPGQVLAVEVRDLDLSRIGGNSPSGEPYGFALLLVCLHRVPLGTLVLDLRDGVPDEADVRELVAARFGGAIEDHFAADARLDESSPCVRLARVRAEAVPVSVVLATYRRPDLIVPCVESILDSDHPAFEVIVVDNAPDDPRTCEVVALKFGSDPRVRYVQQPRPGTSFARNLGIALASTDLVAVTDDDVVVAPTWLPNLVAAMADDRVACATGLVCPYELETEAQLWFEQHGGMGQGFRRRTFADGMAHAPTLLFPFTPAVGASNNMMIRRSTVMRLGGFDVRLGPGTPTCGGEDLDLFVRLLLDGHEIVYEPAAVAWHRHRRSEEELRAHVHGYGVGSVAVLTKWFLQRPELRAKVVRHVRELPGAFVAGSGETPFAASPLPRRIARAKLTGGLAGPARWLRSAMRS